jgi:hypothetical protein
MTNYACGSFTEQKEIKIYMVVGAAISELPPHACYCHLN